MTVAKSLQDSRSEPGWLHSMRSASLSSSESMPMPTQFDGDYRYTSLKGLDLSLAVDRSRAEPKLTGKAASVVFMPLGRAVKEHEGLVKKYLFKGCVIEDKFVRLNMALWDGGVFVYVPEGVKAGRLRAAFSPGKSSFSHTLIVLEPGSSLDYYEELSSGNGEMLACGTTEVHVGDNASCNFFSFQSAGPETWDISYKSCMLAKDARMGWNFGWFGSRLGRLRLDTMLQAEGASCENVGVFFGTGRQHMDISTNAHHSAPSTTNNILVKGVLSGNASGVYKGLIRIDKAAQKTDSYLANNILLLSDSCLANSIPSLKIDANDVKASHGATVGQIDEEQIFYLMARGLTRKQAEQAIVEGFFAAILEKVADEDIKSRYKGIISRLMEA